MTGSRPAGFVAKVTKAARHPQLALLRMAARVESRVVTRLKNRLDTDREREESLRFLSEEFDCDAASYLEEYRRSDLPERCAAELSKLDRSQSSSMMDCESLYLTVRSAKPAVMVETGVLHGAMSWHVLAAMERNGAGVLHSIDLPRASDDPRPPLGFLIPEPLRGSWKLHIGHSLSVLPDLLDDLGEIDLFHHDSLHTVEHMLMEYALAHAALRPWGTLTSHDVVHSEHYPNAFPAFVSGFRYRWTCCRNLGIARKIPREAPERAADR